MLEIAGLAIGVVGLVFAFETPRKAFIGLFHRRANHITYLNPPTVTTPATGTPDTAASRTSGATQSGRYPFFIGEPFSQLDLAIAESQKSKKPLFLVIFDAAHPSRSQLYYSLGCFLDYFTTKRLVEDHFVTALITSDSDEAKKLIPPDDPLENALWIVRSPEGKILRQEGVYANPDEGLKRVRSIVAQYAKL